MSDSNIFRGTGASGDQMVCPKCGTEFSCVAKVPDEQRMTFAISHEGPLISAETVGGTISNIRDLLRATARQSGASVEVFVESLKKGAGKVEVGLVIMKSVPEKKK